MKKLERIVVGVVACFLVVTVASQAEAHPYRGLDCTRCHANQIPASSMLEVDPSQPLTDFGFGKVLRTYTAAPGDTVNLLMNVIDGGEKYAPVLKGLNIGGLNDSSNLLVFTPDPSWTFRTGGEEHYTLDNGDFSGLSWGGSETPHTFQLQLDPSTPLDTYELVFGVGTKGGGPLRYAEESFYLNVVPEPGALMLWGMGLVAFALYVRRRK